MKLVLNTKNFRRAISLADRVASRTAPLPILSNILLKTEGGRLKFSATNLEVGISCTIGAKIEEVGEIAVSARMLSEVSGAIEDEQLQLTTKNNNLFISSKRHKLQVLGVDSKEFPIIPHAKGDALCRLPSRVLKGALASCLDSIAVSETRPELAGLFMKFLPRQINCAATDGFRLVEKIIAAPCKTEAKVIMPRNTVMEAIRILEEEDSEVALSAGDNQISIQGEDFELISRLIDGTYPDYTKIIPEKTIAKAEVSRGELERVVKLAGVFSSSISDIVLSCSKERVIVNAKNSDRGEVEANAGAELTGESFSLSLNYHYFLDGLKVMNGDKIVLEFAGPGTPLIIRPIEKSGLLYLVMPLRGVA